MTRLTEYVLDIHAVFAAMGCAITQLKFEYVQQVPLDSVIVLVNNDLFLRFDHRGRYGHMRYVHGNDRNDYNVMQYRLISGNRRVYWSRWDHGYIGGVFTEREMIVDAFQTALNNLKEILNGR